MLDLMDFHDLIGFEILAVASVEKVGGEMLKLENGYVFELEFDEDTIVELDEVAICRKAGDAVIYKLITEDGVKDVTLLRKGTPQNGGSHY